MKACKKIVYDYTPILVVAAVLPLLVYVHVYQYSSEQVAMMREPVELSDMFSYGKSVFFGIVTCWMIWCLTSDALVREKKNRETANRIFILLLALGAWQTLSTFWTGYKSGSCIGFP